MGRLTFPHHCWESQGLWCLQTVECSGQGGKRKKEKEKIKTCTGKMQAFSLLPFPSPRSPHHVPSTHPSHLVNTLGLSLCAPPARITTPVYILDFAPLTLKLGFLKQKEHLGKHVCVCLCSSTLLDYSDGEKGMLCGYPAENLSGQGVCVTTRV